MVLGIAVFELAIINLLVVSAALIPTTTDGHADSTSTQIPLPFKWRKSLLMGMLRSEIVSVQSYSR